ncbi:MAG: hypothetical protein NC311_11135, partial [Muribaculaceae bacterium]|nr:hypothetical protein [Muribaculaceae bacterium]
STPFRVTNLSTLVECVRRMGNTSDMDAYAAAQKEWQRLTVAEIESAEISQSLRWKGSDAAHPMYPNAGSQLNSDETLQKTLILSQLQSAVSRFDAAVAADPTLRLNWNNIQYLLLNAGALPTDPDVVDGQKNYYWWQNGSTTGTSVNISTAGTVNTNIGELIRATYRADFNDPGVMSSILAATQAEGNSFWAYTKLTTARVQGTTFPRADDPVEPNANDTYDGPDVLADLEPHAYPGATEDDVRDFLTLLTQFRDAAKADPNQGTSDPYGMPDYNWQEIQYYCLTNTFLPYSDQIIRDLRDQEKALAGDYWWYYAEERVPPEPPRQDVPEPPPNPAAPLVDALVAIGDGSLDIQDFIDSLDPDVFDSWGIVNLDGSPIDWDGVDAIQNGMWEDPVAQLADYGLTPADLTWPQLQLMFGTYPRDWYWAIAATEDEALAWLAGEGAMLVSDGGYIPDEYGQIYPEIFGLARSLFAGPKAAGELVIIEELQPPLASLPPAAEEDAPNVDPGEPEAPAPEEDEMVDITDPEETVDPEEGVTPEEAVEPEEVMEPEEGTEPEEEEATPPAEEGAAEEAADDHNERAEVPALDEAPADAGNDRVPITEDRAELSGLVSKVYWEEKLRDRKNRGVFYAA